MSAAPRPARLLESARRAADERLAFGYGKVTYFWALPGPVREQARPYKVLIFKSLLIYLRGRMMTDETPSFWQAIRSVLAAFLGVQSDKNRELDFRHGKPAHFIVAGLLLTLLFILVVWGVVKLVLNAAGV